MSWVVSGLIGGVVAIALGVVARRTQKNATMDQHGWKQLRPSWLIHATLLGCLAFAAVIGGFFIMGGSSRSDAEEQNLWALGLLVAFSGAGLWLWWAAYLGRICWKGNQIVVSAPFRDDMRHRFSDIADVTFNADESEAKLHMADGRVIKVNTYFNGFHELMVEMERQYQLARRTRS